MLYRENFIVFYLSYVQNVWILCGQNVGFINVKTSGKYTNR